MSKSLIIPLVDLHREYRFLKKDIGRRLKSCFKSQQWILGKEVAAFERRISGYIGTKEAIGVASGTDALLLSLRALAMRQKKGSFFREKDEVHRQ